MDQARPIIIKKSRGGGGGDGGHHGGAWKVAYADFVTAMMAFFLLMWLLNATTEDQRKGLADFFDPKIPISRNSAGGAGMLNGDTPLSPTDAASTRTEGVRPKPTHAEAGEDLGDLDKAPDRPEGTTAPSTYAEAAPESEARESDDSADDEDAADGQQEEALEDVTEDLMAELSAAGRDGLLEHFTLRTTPEGLVIEMGDLHREPLFGSGAADPRPILDVLVDILVPVLNRTTNDIAVVGHTDATPFAPHRPYTNWELSADRANAARRLLGERGLPAGRIVRVSGKAATDPISPDPMDPRNRRIALILLRRNLAD